MKESRQTACSATSPRRHPTASGLADTSYLRCWKEHSFSEEVPLGVIAFISLRGRVFSARSSLVNGPSGSLFSSTAARFTQARTLVSVSPSSPRQHARALAAGLKQLHHLGLVLLRERPSRSRHGLHPPSHRRCPRDRGRLRVCQRLRCSGGSGVREAEPILHGSA